MSTTMQRKLLALCVAVAAAPAAASGADWLTSYDKAVEKAGASGKPVLLAFVNGGEETSKALETKVFRNGDFAAVESDVVLVRLDFAAATEEKDALKSRFGVEALPTVLVLRFDGTEAGRLGYADESARQWLDKLGPLVEQASGLGQWLTDYEFAKRLAKATGKPILADFTGSDWCIWCIRLKDEVFDTPEFDKWARANVVLLELDFPNEKEIPAEIAAQNDRLKDEFGIKGFPTIVFIDGDGEEIDRSGYIKGGPGPWIADAKEKLE